jgi:hypothetical protein
VAEERRSGGRHPVAGRRPAAICLAGCAVPDRPGPPPATAPATAPDGIRDRTVAWDAGRLDADPRRVVVSWTGASPEARWREGRRGLAVAATFPTAPSGRAVAAVRDLLVRVARGLE